MTVELVGRVAPFVILAALIGAGSNMLYYTLDVDTPTAKWVAFQIFNGFGRGLGMPIVSPYPVPPLSTLLNLRLPLTLF